VINTLDNDVVSTKRFKL